MRNVTTLQRRRSLGLPWWALLGLAALAVPRVLVHDLQIEVAPWVTPVLALGPPAVWIAVALWRRVSSPVLTLVVIGMLYGVALGIGHNLMFESAFDGAPPTLGGNLEGNLPASVEMGVIRLGMMVSSILTGSLVGLISGLVAQLLSALRDRQRE